MFSINRFSPSFFVFLCATLFVCSISIRELRNEKGADTNLLRANTVYPDSNACAAKAYFDLPFCSPGNPVKSKKKSLEEILEGDCFTNTRYELDFKVDKHEETLCEKNLTKDEVVKFRYAIKNRFGYQLYFNGIKQFATVGALVKSTGSLQPDHHYLFRHINFKVHYIGNEVHGILIDTPPVTSIRLPEDIDVINVKFTYSVYWYELEYFFKDILEQKNRVEEQQQKLEKEESYLHMVFGGLLVYFLSAMYLLPFLCWYLNRGVRESETQLNGAGYGDPLYPSLLGAILGAGSMLLILLCSLLILHFAVYQSLCYMQPFINQLLKIYLITAFFSGCIAVTFLYRYTAAGRAGWHQCTFLTSVLYLVPAVAIFFTVNDFEVKDNNAYIDLRDFFIWAICTFVLVYVGGFVGFLGRDLRAKRLCGTLVYEGGFLGPPSPQAHWYTKAGTQATLGGFLTFCIIFSQMDYIYAIMWNQKVCGAFSTLLTSFIELVVSTIVVSMLSTCIQIRHQHQDWLWRSVFQGGSVSILMFVYGIYFYVRATVFIRMKPVVYFLGYNCSIFYALFLVLGTISYYASRVTFDLLMYKEAPKREE